MIDNGTRTTYIIEEDKTFDIADMKGKKIIDEYITKIRSFNVVENEDYKSKSPHKCNILLIGPKNSGKSSLVRTLYLVLNETRTVSAEIEEYIKVAPYAHVDGKKFHRVVLLEKKDNMDGYETESKSNDEITISDSRGNHWMDEDEKEQLKFILEGRVKNHSLVEKTTENDLWFYQKWFNFMNPTKCFPKEIINYDLSLGQVPHSIILVFNGSEEKSWIRDIDELYKDIYKFIKNGMLK